MLKRKTALIVLSIVLALALIAASMLAVVFNPHSDIFADNSADTSANAATITGSTAFGKLTNGSKFYYTNATTAGETAVTVNSSAAWGSATNPFVINSAATWVGFADSITAQTSTYAGAKYWVLDADINLGGATIKAVGRHSTGFQGTLYGNKHTISNGIIQWETWIGNASHAVGLFHKTNGASIYDLTIANNIQYTMKTDIPENVFAFVGGVVAISYNTTFVNVHNKANINIAQTCTTGRTCCYCGGFTGQSNNGIKIYKSIIYSGKIAHAL